MFSSGNNKQRESVCVRGPAPFWVAETEWCFVSDQNRLQSELCTWPILAMRVLEFMFFVGLAGSTVVVIISFIEDAKELFGDD